MVGIITSNWGAVRLLEENKSLKQRSAPQLLGLDTVGMVSSNRVLTPHIDLYKTQVFIVAQYQCEHKHKCVMASNRRTAPLFNPLS